MPYDATIRERARKLVQTGYSNTCAAEIVGVTHETIRRWAAEGKWRKPKELSLITEKRLRVLVNKGWGCQTVSRQLNIYPAMLKRLMRERGLEFSSASRSRALSAALKKGKREQWLDVIKKRSEQELTERENCGEFIR